MAPQHIHMHPPTPSQVGGVSGQRVVFDASGKALEPLALLAEEGYGSEEVSPGSLANRHGIE